MRTIEVERYGEPEVLTVGERPVPEPGPGQVLVEVRAAGLNFADLISRSGRYPHNVVLPYVGGYEVAGVVRRLGEAAGSDRPGTSEGSGGPAVGDRVAAFTNGNGFAEYVAVDRREVVRLPEHFSFEEGATVPIPYATALAGLCRYANVQPGERVLITSAAGGVGIAAVQLAKHLGAVVDGAASPGKHDALRRLGVDAALDYTSPGWETGLPPYDVVMDAVGGESFARSYRLLRAGGRLVAYGVTSAFAGPAGGPAGDFREITGLRSADQMIDSKTVIGLDLQVLRADRGSLGPWLRPVQDVLDAGIVRPLVAAVVPFAEAARAHHLLAERRTVGKVVLVP